MHRYIVLHTYVLCIYRYLNASPRGITSIVCPWSKDQASQLLGAESAHRFHWSLEKTSMKSKNPMGELERVNRCFFFTVFRFLCDFPSKKLLVSVKEQVWLWRIWRSLDDFSAFHPIQCTIINVIFLHYSPHQPLIIIYYY